MNFLKDMPYRQQMIWLLMRLPLAILVCLAIMLALDYTSINFWQHDSVYYDPAAAIKIKYEGRWLIPVVAPLLAFIDGKLIAVLDLACLFYFYYFVCSALGSTRAYALAFACLAIQFLPHAYQLMWPVNSAPSAFFLVLATVLVTRVNVLIFYPILGILYFSSGSYFYYLLPLLHLPLVLNADSVRDALVSAVKVLTCWGIGFVVGYLTLLCVVYMYTIVVEGVGQWGLEIRAWRQPNHASEWYEYVRNAVASFGVFKEHIQYLLYSGWIQLSIAVAVLLRLFKIDWGNLSSLVAARYIGLSVVLIAMLVAHYIVTIPVGIRIDVRSMSVLWASIFMAVFWVQSDPRPTISKALLLWCMVGVAFMNFKENENNLNVYRDIGDVYYADFVEAMPVDIGDYEGILFMSSNFDVAATNNRLLRPVGGYNGKIPWLNYDTRWAPNALVYGFDTVHLCGTRNKRTELCSRFWQAVRSGSLVSESDNSSDTFHQIWGEFEGYLVVYLKPAHLIKR